MKRSLAWCFWTVRKKPVIPTEAGEVVLEQARETIKAYNYIKEAVSELKGETAGKLRLGVIPTIAPYLLCTNSSRPSCATTRRSSWKYPR